MATKTWVKKGNLKGPKGDTGDWGGFAPLLSTTDLDSLDSGFYYPISPSAATTMGLPTANYGALEAFVTGTGTETQRWQPASTDGSMWIRSKVSGVWTAWEAAGWWKGDVPLLSTADIDNLPDGAYRPISNSAATAMGLPTANQGALEIYTSDDSRVQYWKPITSKPQLWTRSRVGTTWNPWTQIGATSGALQRDVRVATFRRRRGRVGTGGRPAVALVFDHGLDAFATHVLPLLRSLNLPATLGLNSQMYDPAYIFAGTAGAVTWAQIQDWAVNDGVEIWNHGRTHTQPTGEVAMRLEIEGGRDELEAALPLVPVEGWLHTGEYGAFNHGATPAAYWENLVGSIILNGHATATGDMPGTIHPLAGNIAPGWDGVWLDNSTATAQAVIEDAMVSGGGVMTRLHPQFLGDVGSLSVAGLSAFLTWVAQQRDAGELVVLSGGGMAVADAAVGDRDNLLPSGFSGGLNGWAGTGWTAANGAAVSPATTAALSRTVSLTRADYARGSVRELHATVNSPAGSVVRLTATGTGLNASKDFTIPAGTWVDIRTFLTIPKTGADTVTFNLSRVSGGVFSARQINAYSA